MTTAFKQPHPNSGTSNNGYVGRFAPSPSGHLHFGSLVSALGSYLQAKSQAGRWLLRIEDIDPPREVAGSSDAIMRSLEAHNLHWDGEVVYQSSRSQLYHDKIQFLSAQGFTYYCQCTRAQLASLDIGQSCVCETQKLTAKNSAVRFIFPNDQPHFFDQLLGKIDFPKQQIPAQFTIKRKDGVFAYQLAVVVDDIQQGITEVARGADLIDSTFYQLALYQAFGQPAPKFLHFPVVVTEPGKKLSKQNHACQVNSKIASANLIHGLGFLGLTETHELQGATPEMILDWAIPKWDLRHIPAKTECIDNRIGHEDSI